ncbi:hypothetical protein LCGC14_0793570 [marine sediment metagenome]|uniref:Uncharacterized protein n=1 Tax=marine sediment metagenome TaxID=412755 RepID=A0A0F9SZ03_9ZZZZ
MSIRSAIDALGLGGKGFPRALVPVIAEMDKELKAVAGKIGPFDPAVDTGAETVTGNITSATSSVASAGIGNLAVVIPEQPNANYMVLVTAESEGTVTADEDVLPPIVDAKTTTGFNLRMVNGLVVTRSISYNILILPVA